MQLESDTPVGIAKSMGLGLIGFGEALQQLQPDLMLVLGDRFEMLSAVAAAHWSRESRSRTCTAAKRPKARSTKPFATRSPRCRTCISSPRRNIDSG